MTDKNEVWILRKYGAYDPDDGDIMGVYATEEAAREAGRVRKEGLDPEGRYTLLMFDVERWQVE